MRSFLSEVASDLYERYGDGLSSLCLVFPSRRARLFFCDALAGIALRPMWQPRFLSLGEIMEHVAGVRCSDPVRLVTELYKVYSRYHNESFDSFYFWGDTLLADFDQIDKYLIDADMLFTNIGDLKAIGDDRSYLTPEQMAVVTRFWSSFGIESEFSAEKEHFMAIWKSLAAIYHEFRDRLAAQGLAYEGMVHRLAAGRLSSDEAVDFPGDADTRYAVVGFNALSECEKRLFARLKASGRAEFFWDYDRYYTDNPDFEAGMFLRENIRLFPMPDLATVTCDHFREAKRVEVVSAPSDSLQCKFVHTFLTELAARGVDPGKQTAIVLTDESLLLPVLYSIPESVAAVNVTMGYPLRQTTAYSFVERLIELQNRSRKGRDGLLFYHSDVAGLLSHPYLQETEGEAADALAAEILHSRSVYVRCDRFAGNELFARLFREVSGWQPLAAYIREILSLIAVRSAKAEDAAQRREFFSVMIDHIVRVENSLSDCGLDVGTGVFASVLRKMLQLVRIPYEGEPLAGVQVMGILETRNLDFEHVLVLSVNDDTFPGNLAVSSSFIPYNLRYAYGLPTPQHHEGVYAYYFYRLAQRASTVTLAYCSRSDDKRTGEPSRYIYQLDYESPHRLSLRHIPLGVNLTQAEPVSVPKTGDVARTLSEFLDGGARRLSPTSFYQYVECPLKFYFRSVAGLKPEEEMAEEIDLPMFGTILHRAMELLYGGLKNDPAPQHAIGRLRGSDAVRQAVMRAINEEYLHDSAAAEEEYGGNMILVRDVVGKYINDGILPYDAAQSGFTVQRLEAPVEAAFAFGAPDGRHTVVFAGKADRIDRLDDGTLRVVDYKTGRQHIRFRDLDALFDGSPRERSAAVLQTLLYSQMLYRAEGCEVQPALYYVRHMRDGQFSPLLMEGDTPVARFSDYREGLADRLERVLGELFDFGKPFVQCDTPEVCEYCYFREICRK